MIAEVAVRFLALRHVRLIVLIFMRCYSINEQLFWKSLWNVGDVLLVGLCVITLIVLGFGECGESRSTEAVAEEIVLVLRNGAQLVRLMRMVAKYVILIESRKGPYLIMSSSHRNRRQLTTRNTNIDFGSIIGTSPNQLAPDILPGGTFGSYDTNINWEEDDDFL